MYTKIHSLLKFDLVAEGCIRLYFFMLPTLLIFGVFLLASCWTMNSPYSVEGSFGTVHFMIQAGIPNR